MTTRRADDDWTMTLAASARPDHDPSIQTRFWTRHIRIGFSVLAGESLVVMVYLGMTPHGPHRPLLWGVTVGLLVFSAVNLVLAPRLAALSWRGTFSATWTVVSIVMVAVVAMLDSGVDSPLLELLFLALAFAGLAYTPRVTALCGGTALAGTLLVVLTDATMQEERQTMFLLFGMLAGASVLAVAAAVNRSNRERRERVLTDQIAELASTDGLTGCAVHRVFYERLSLEIARSQRHGHPLSLILVDVDDFKGVNDSYGHLVGDHVLAGIGAVLRARVRSVDLVARLGGDEFGVLLPDTDRSAAAAFAERVRREACAGLEVPVTLSIGVSGFDGGAPTAEHIVDEADFALYQVKRAGRDGVAVRHEGREPPAGDAHAVTA